MNLLLTFFFSALITLALVHITAINFLLYWRYVWLDIPVHVLGGICVSLGIAILPFLRISLPAHFQKLSMYCGAVLLVGIGWEIFEIMAGIPVTEEGFLFDVFLDLCMDVLGGAIGYGIVISLRKYIV